MSAPEGSSEPALDFAARVAGTYDPAARHLAVSSLALRTSSGELLAEGSVDFVDGKPPGRRAGGDVAGNVAQPRQAALAVHRGRRKARRWAMNNLFDGQITNGEAAVPRAARPHRQRRSACPATRCPVTSTSRTRVSTLPDGFRRCAMPWARSTSAATTSTSRWPPARPSCRTAQSVIGEQRQIHDPQRPSGQGDRNSRSRHRRRGVGDHAARLL